MGCPVGEALLYRLPDSWTDQPAKVTWKTESLPASPSCRPALIALASPGVMTIRT